MSDRNSDKYSWGNSGSTNSEYDWGVTGPKNSWGEADPKNDRGVTGPGASAGATATGSNTVKILAVAAAIVVVVGGIAWAAMSAGSSGDSDGSDEAAAASSSASAPKKSESASEAAQSEDEEAATSLSTESSAARTTKAKPAEPIKNAGVSLEEKCGRYADELLTELRRPIKMHCDDAWLYAGDQGTDHTGVFQWNNGSWQRYQADDTTFTGFSCYDRNKLEAAGAPASLVEEVLTCRGGSSASDTQVDTAGGSELCDGRYILIAESVIIPPGTNPAPETNRVHQEYPGSRLLKGDKCSSLRGKVDGGEVYAIYFDAGHDVNEVCRLKSQYGGNARSLNNNADFTDPC